MKREPFQSFPFFADKTLQSVCPLLPRKHGNAVMRVETTDGCFVVRQGTRGERDMEVEYRAARLAHTAGIAPEILAYDATWATMVQALVPGEHLTQLEDAQWVRLGRALRTLHALPYRDADFPMMEMRHIIDPDQTAITEAFGVVERFPPEWALCHHDLTPRNMLWDGDEVMLIDFEFAGIGEVCFDVAAVCVEFELAGGARRTFLSSYFGDGRCPDEKLSAWETLYRALRRQWFARHSMV